MTHYYIRATSGRRVLKTEEIERDTIQLAQGYATKSFVANLRLESIDITALKIDILLKPDPLDPLWAPSCRARYRPHLRAWTWAYPPD